MGATCLAIGGTNALQGRTKVHASAPMTGEWAPRVWILKAQMPQLRSDSGPIAQKGSNLNGTGILFLLLLLYYNIIAYENKLIRPNQRVAFILVK
jgi:hypothetical protein